MGTTDSYRAALVTLLHTPIRFLGGAIGEVADAHNVTRLTVENDLFDLEREQREERADATETYEEAMTNAGRGHLL